MPGFICEILLLRQSRITGMQGVDHYINGLMARLMYKAADKATGVEKTKQQAEGEKHTDSKRERDSCCTENRQGMTWMLQLQR